MPFSSSLLTRWLLIGGLRPFIEATQRLAGLEQAMSEGQTRIRYRRWATNPTVQPQALPRKAA